MVISGEFKESKKREKTGTYFSLSGFLNLALKEVRPSMVKKIATFNIDEQVLILAKRLKINRSQAAEEGIRKEISVVITRREQESITNRSSNPNGRSQ